MPKIELNLSEDQYQFLKTLADKKQKTMDEIVEEWIKPILSEKRVEIAVKEYKAGNLNAKEAWKLSGLTFTEFLQRVEQ